MRIIRSTMVKKERVSRDVTEVRNQTGNDQTSNSGESHEVNCPPVARPRRRPFIDPDVILIGSSSDEAENDHYSDISDSDPVEECYNIFMEADGEKVTGNMDLPVPTDGVATQTDETEISGRMRVLQGQKGVASETAISPQPVATIKPSGLALAPQQSTSSDTQELQQSGSRQVPMQSDHPGYPPVMQVFHLHYMLPEGNYPLPSHIASTMTSVPSTIAQMFTMPATKTHAYHPAMGAPVHFPVHASVPAPLHTAPVPTPLHVPVQYSPHAPHHDPVQYSPHVPAHAPHHSPVHPIHVNVQYSPHTPVHPTHTPVHAPVHPAHAPVHAPVHPTHAPVHPAHAPVHTPVHPTHAPVHPAHTPVHAPVHPTHAPVHPAHTPVHTPVHPTHVPVHPAHAPVHAPVHPAHAPVHAPVHPTHAPVHPAHTPVHAPVHPTHAPVHPAHTPVHTPVHPTHVPVHPAHAPVHAPVHPTHAPVHPAHAPVHPAHAPVHDPATHHRAPNNPTPSTTAVEAKFNAPSLTSVTASIHRRQTTPSVPICIPAQPMLKRKKNSCADDEVLHDEPPPTKRKAKNGPEEEVNHDMRQRCISQFTEALLKTSNMSDAFAKALTEEKNVYNRSNNAVKYQSVVVNALKKLKTQSHVTAAKGHVTAAKDGKEVGVQRGSIPLKTKMLQGNATLYEVLKGYLLTEAARIEQGYPFLHTRRRYCAVLLGGHKKVTTDSFKKICSRCGATYSVGQTGRHTRMEECNYHYGKGVEKKVPGGVETRYSCCEAVMGSPGCQVFKLHVHDGVSLDGFVVTTSRPATDKSCPGVYSLNCEKCYTTRGVELSRVTLVNSSLQILYDTFVRPANDVIDYNTRFSGISERDVKDVNISIKEVQKTLQGLIRADTILIGHSLDMDLCLLKLIHGVVVDTSVVFPHRLGPPHKLALNTLVTDHLRRIVQDSVCGHDTAEDALACMELMLWKTKEAGKVRRF